MMAVLPLILFLLIKYRVDNKDIKEEQIPSRQNKIIQHIQQQSEDNPDCHNMVPILQKIEYKQYANVAEVIKH